MSAFPWRINVKQRHMPSFCDIFVVFYALLPLKRSIIFYLRIGYLKETKCYDRGNDGWHDKGNREEEGSRMELDKLPHAEAALQGWSLINFHMHRQLYTHCMRTHEMYQHNTCMYIYEKHPQ